MSEILFEIDRVALDAAIDPRTAARLGPLVERALARLLATQGLDVRSGAARAAASAMLEALPATEERQAEQLALALYRVLRGLV